MFRGVNPYIAKCNHKQPCSLCGEPIMKGDQCDRWLWCKAKEDRLSIVATIRVHLACHKESSKYDWFDEEDGWFAEFPLKEQRAENAFDDEKTAKLVR